MKGLVFDLVFYNICNLFLCSRSLM